MSGGELAVRRTLDLTRDPRDQWNEKMFQLVASQVLKRASTLGEQVYCLAVADALALNPFIGEIYFIPSKSRDGSGPGITPYIGRTGLVKKATERGYYFEAETVRESDRFRMTRRKDQTVEVTHSYGHEKDRGEIVGAYAFLNDETGRRKPAFFYAPLDEYLPSFDQEWKMEASPWGNQRSAMIEKCAMIGAGRKRLDLGNVLADGEVARVAQMEAIGPRSSAPEPSEEPSEFDFAGLTEDRELAERLRVAARGAGWPVAKSEMILSGCVDAELREWAERLEREAEAAGRADEPEEVVDAQVVPEPGSREEFEARLAEIDDALNDPYLPPEEGERLAGERAAVEREMMAAGNPDQERML